MESWPGCPPYLPRQKTRYGIRCPRNLPLHRRRNLSSRSHSSPPHTYASHPPSKTRPCKSLASTYPQQFESFSKVWPIKGFTERHRSVVPPTPEPSYRRTLPKDIYVSEMEKCMLAAIRLSQRVYKIQDKPPYNLPIATLIVDPATSRIVASTFDTRVSTGQPLNHSVVTAINLLAIS